MPAYPDRPSFRRRSVSERRPHGPGCRRAAFLGQQWFETERAKSKRLQQELADEKVTSEKLLELSKERQKGCKNIGEKLTEAEDKLKKLKDCCGERSKLLLKIEELKGDIESIKNAAKTEGPSRLTMEMRIKHLRRKY